MKRLVIFTCTILACSIANAQTETINWYVDNENYATTTCEIGGDIDLPITPYKKGYTFQGWQPAVYDISTLDPSIDGINTLYKDNKVKVEFSYGDVYVDVLCSSTSSVEPNIDIETTYGGFCYFRVTAFIPTGSNIIYEPKSLSWKLFSSDYGNACASKCIGYVNRDLWKSVSLRKKLYGIN